MAKGKTTAAKGKRQRAKEPIAQIDGAKLADDSLSADHTGKQVFDNVLDAEKIKAEMNSSESKVVTIHEGKTSFTPIAIPNTANVIWSSEKKEDGSLKYGNPPASVRIGIDVIEVPDAETQLKGFHSKHAARLVRNIPGYKYLKSKGEK